MKSQTSVFTPRVLWALAAAAFLGAISMQAETTRSLRAEVHAVTGSASFQLPGKAATRIRPGTTIPAGAVITTGAGSTVDVWLGRNTGVIRLSPNTTLRISTLKSTDTGSDVVTETAIELQEGEIFGNVNKMTQASTYEITLPDGKVEVAQSRFQLTHRTVDALTDPSGSSRGDSVPGSTIRLISGNVSFAHDGTTTEINGQGEFTSGSSTVVPLSPETSQALAQLFKSFGPSGPAAETAGGNNGSVKPRTLALVQPQEVPMSPTSGSGN
jgi:uncharacterized cupredoxin-like copper-binding protein